LKTISDPWHYLVCDCSGNSKSEAAALDAIQVDGEDGRARFMRVTLPEYLSEWDEKKMFARAKERSLAGFVKVLID
jgi:hypothetical protein